MGMFCSIFRPVSLVRPLEPLLGFRPEKRASKFSDSFSTVDMELSCDSHVFHISSHSFEEADMAGHSQIVESCVQTNCCFYLFIYIYDLLHLCSFTGCQNYVISNLVACIFCVFTWSWNTLVSRKDLLLPLRLTLDGPGPAALISGDKRVSKITVECRRNT